MIRAAHLSVALAAAATLGLTQPPPTGCAVAATHQISAIQGAGAASPVTNQNVRVEGIVTGDFQAAGQLGGFYIQDDTPDADPATSEGLFVFAGLGFADVHVGQRVLVSGRAIEFNDLTELSPVSAVDICGNGTITATTVDLPRPAGASFEPTENMLVTFPETLTVTDHFGLGRFGEVTVSSDGRLFQPTDRVAAGAAALAVQQANDRRRLVIDDGSSGQHPAPLPFVKPRLPLRTGDTVTGVTGVLTFGFGSYRLQPTRSFSFTPSNARPAVPAAVGGDIRIAGFNTLNYFTTLTAENRNARGADSAEEFARQQAKEVAALVGLDADVIGLMEIQNNGATAIASLVAALNAAAGAGTYAFVADPALNPANEFGGTFGTDAIKVGIIFRPAAVIPLGPSRSSADDVFSRPPLVQTFRRSRGGEPFTIVVNHLKSRNCADASGADLDQGDGQSCFNARRIAQVSALVSFLSRSGFANVLLIGDLNAHGEEGPIRALKAAGYISVTERLVAAEKRYSYSFGGQAGELDHAFAAPDLVDNVTGATIWHINADEATVFDYNQETNPPALYAPDAYRASDHDPILVGLRF